MKKIVTKFKFVQVEFKFIFLSISQNISLIDLILSRQVWRIIKHAYTITE